eukprot:1483639-Rhodomonas_salina.1
MFWTPRLPRVSLTRGHEQLRRRPMAGSENKTGMRIMTAIVFVMVVMVPAVLGLADGNALSGHSSVALHSTIGMGPNKRKTQELLAAASSVSRLRGGGAASANASAPTDADLDLVTCMFEIQVSHTQPGDVSSLPTQPKGCPVLTFAHIVSIQPGDIVVLMGGAPR